MTLKDLLGKTIAQIEQPAILKMPIEGSSRTVTRTNDNLVITFTDGTVLKLASWDYEGYSSGMDMEISKPVTEYRESAQYV